MFFLSRRECLQVLILLKVILSITYSLILTLIDIRKYLCHPYNFVPVIRIIIVVVMEVAIYFLQLLIKVLFWLPFQGRRSLYNILLYLSLLWLVDYSRLIYMSLQDWNGSCIE
jgi:hypothetical protein